jgi:hypothetical protein
MTQDHNVNMPNRRAFFFPSPCYGGEKGKFRGSASINVIMV